MSLFRRLFLGASVRLAVVPLTLPCLIATCWCCCVVLGPRDAHCQGPEVGLRLGMGGPPTAHAGGVQAIGCDGSLAGSKEDTNRCGCCPISPDAKRPSVVRGSIQDRIKASREVRSVFQTGSLLKGSSAAGFRSPVSAWAASRRTSAENCILLCRLLL